MTQYFFGTDTGATKSHALLSDDTGRVLGFAQGGTGNPQGIGFKNLVALLDDLITQCTTQAGVSRESIAGVGFGIAGYDWPSHRDKFVSLVGPLNLNAKMEFANDTIVGLIAGASQGWGVAIVSGTSSNCRGRDRHGRIGRMTGYGTAFGEYGGASELVMKAMEGVTREWSKRGPATRLTQAFIELAGVDSLDALIEGATTAQIPINSQAARVVFRVAEEGDKVAQDVVRWCALGLADQVNGVVRQLGFEREEFEVVQVGSLFEGGKLLTEPMQRAVQAVAPRARFVRLTAPPVVGGVLLGMEQAGLAPTPEIRQRLVETARVIMTKGPA